MAAAKTNNSHGHTHPHAIEVHDEESGELGVLGGCNDPARMKCATTRCGLESSGRLAADVAKRAESSRMLSKAVVVCLVFMAIEVAGGVMANSLAIFTDAAHMLTDVAGFAISLFAIWASGWEATPSQTFGFARLEILGALGSILLIWLLTGILVYEAIHRLFFAAVADAVDGRLMFIIATLGLLVNLAMMYLLGHNHSHGHGHDHSHDHNASGHDHTHNHNASGHDHTHEETNQVHTVAAERHHEHHDHIHDTDNGGGNHNHSRNTGHKHCDTGLNEPFLKTNSVTLSRDLSKRNLERNINVQGAYLHVLGDLLQSVGVMIGGAAIWYNPKWKFIDPVCTLLFSILVLATTIKMIRDILGILMESTPREIDAQKVESGLLELPGVVEVHDLHIWAITIGKTLLACHIRVGSHMNTDEVLQMVTDYCETKFKITHVTIQIERDF